MLHCQLGLAVDCLYMLDSVVDATFPFHVNMQFQNWPTTSSVGLHNARISCACVPRTVYTWIRFWKAMIYLPAVGHYCGWRKLCVRAQPCMQGSGDAAYLLSKHGMLCCLKTQCIQSGHIQSKQTW
jgi:hypothetical protein